MKKHSIRERKDGQAGCGCRAWAVVLRAGFALDCVTGLVLVGLTAAGLMDAQRPAFALPVSPVGAQRCSAMLATDYSTIADATTKISTAGLIPAAAQLPAVCQIEGKIEGRIGFMLRLPMDGWNHKFIELGCGGFCGSTAHNVDCDDPLRRGYACVVSDGGHRGTSLDGRWAYHNLASVIDYFVAASHLTALAGKALTTSFYGMPLTKSYFAGCSAGGQQAMMEAQRFPWDFNGIIAGQPTSESAFDLNILWGARVFNDRMGMPLFSKADLSNLHQAVVDHCDLNDGVRDGLIGDPRICTFRPSELRCTARTGHCLTPQQVDAADKLYQGPTAQGHAVSLPGALRGSELRWTDWYTGGPGAAGDMQQFAAEPFRYYEFQPNPGPSWRTSEFDFSKDIKRLGLAEGLISATNPDLRIFKSLGGKLIAYAGWSDPGGMPLASVDFYETAERAMGGRSETQKFFRLFMVPGMGHCTGGEGPFKVDYLTALEQWVERASAPDALIGSNVRLSADPHRARAEALAFPIQSTDVAFARPIYPYPLKTKYRGPGDPSQASSFYSQP